MKSYFSITRAVTRRCALLAALLGLGLGSSAVAQSVAFDFDSATPALMTGQNVPFSQLTGGATAHFSASTGTFSVQNYGSTFFILSQFSGNYLYPNGANGVLVIQFSQEVTNLVMDFATAEQKPLENPTPIRLIAYTNSTSTTPVGSTTQAGTYFGLNTLPMGTLIFNSATPFNVVTINIQPGGATGVLLDNLTVKVSGGTNYTIVTSAAPADGGTTAGDGNYLSSAPITLVATANPDFEFVNWTEAGVEVSTSAVYAFAASADRTLMANFVRTYSLTTSAAPTAGGATTGDGTYPNGSVVSVVATPNPGFVFANWTENTIPVSSSPRYAFALSTTRTLEANFAPACLITTSSSSTDAGFTTGDGLYAIGSNVTVVATPLTGYAFVDWTVNDVPVSTAASCSFTGTGDRSLVANFTVNAASVTFDFDTGSPLFTGGETTPLDQTAGGLSAHFSSTNEPAFEIQTDFATGWALPLLSGNYLAPNVNASDTALDIQFSQLVTNVTLSFATLDFQDLVTPSTLELVAYESSTATLPLGTATAQGTYRPGDSMPLGVITFGSATPFGMVRVLMPVATQPPTGFVVDNIVVQGLASPTQSITASAWPSEGGTVSGGGDFTSGSSVTVLAVANPEYSFLNWSEGGLEVSTSAAYTFTFSANRALVANFAPRLGILATSTNTIVLSWPAPLSGYVLQEKSRLEAAVSWVEATNAVDVVGGRSEVILLPAAGNGFFRLFHP